MLSCEKVFESIKHQGINFFTGVPDSLLKDFCAYVSDHVSDESHIISANEGNAIALAMGNYLATGKMALVYMQNSGLGNTINPLTSLADPEVYGIPMMLMIGWRGEPGEKDEPQHIKKGRVTKGLLDTLEIPTFILDAKSSFEAVIADAAKTAMSRKTPVALLVRAKSFETYKLKKERKTSFSMTREEALSNILSALSPEDVVVSTTGMASREVYELRVKRNEGHGRDFLTVGGMGHTSSIAMGIARARPEKRVFCLDGDGSLLMHMGPMTTIGQIKPKNLFHIVINNGAHDSVGGQPTVAFDINLPQIALACGYGEAKTVETVDDLKASLKNIAHSKGPLFLEVRVNKGARADLGRPKSTPADNKNALMNFLGVGN